jgi:ribosome biogenesis GTPase A
VIQYERTNLYIGKINIAVGGFIGSGKSTLINTILGEKRCLEGRGGSITDYISQYGLKNYPINLIDFPGFRAERKGKKILYYLLKNYRVKFLTLKK